MRATGLALNYVNTKNKINLWRYIYIYIILYMCVKQKLITLYRFHFILSHVNVKSTILLRCRK